MNHSGIVIPGPRSRPPPPPRTPRIWRSSRTGAYTDFVSKPYWIPALVDQVDICGTELGSDWHMITEADANDVTDADAQALTTALSTPNSTSFFGNFYFSLHVWVRATDGLGAAISSPGASLGCPPHPSPTPPCTTSPTCPWHPPHARHALNHARSLLGWRGPGAAAAAGVSLY